jgi:hypothetical protein
MLNLKIYLKNNPYIIIGLFTISILLVFMVVAPLLGSLNITYDFTAFAPPCFCQIKGKRKAKGQGESAKAEVRGIDIPNYIYIFQI